MFAGRGGFFLLKVPCPAAWRDARARSAAAAWDLYWVCEQFFGANTLRIHGARVPRIIS